MINKSNIEMIMNEVKKLIQSILGDTNDCVHVSMVEITSVLDKPSLVFEE